MKTDLPLVSIIIPTYNRAWCIKEAIQSALQQTYTNTEIIVVDDGSTDDTVNLLFDYLERIILIRKSNGGVSSARNAGINRSSGDFLIFLDSDDMLSPNIVESHIKKSFEHPEAEVYTADCATFSKNGTLQIQTCSWPEAPSRPLDLVFLNPPPPPACQMYRRYALERVGGYDEQLKCAEDSDILIRVVMTGGELVRTDGGYAIYRPSKDSLTRITGAITYHKSYVFQCKKYAQLYAANVPEVLPYISARLDFWRLRFWQSILAFHYALTPFEISKMGYYLLKVSFVDAGYIRYLLRFKPWRL